MTKITRSNFLILLFLPIMLFCLIFFCACGEDPAVIEPEEEEAFVSTAELLVTEAIDVCGEIYSGYGLSATLSDEVNIDSLSNPYCPVENTAYADTAMLKAVALNYFTEEYAQTYLFPAAFEGDKPLYKDSDEGLRVNVQQQLKHWRTEWQFDTARIVDSGEGWAVLEMEIFVSDNSSGSAQIRFETGIDGAWRIDSDVHIEDHQTGAHNFSMTDIDMSVIESN